MKEYLSHFSAAYHWMIPNLETVFGVEHMNNRRCDDPVHITVSDPSERHKRNGRITHLCGLPYPVGAVKKDRGKYVASPELVFLQLANSLDMNRLILLGLQMCSHPPGKSGDAITTKRKLKTFIEKTSGHRGHLKAMRALKYVEDGSNSIMESIAFMALTLPYSYGGYALTGAVFNHEIKANPNTKYRVRQKRYYIDIFYKKEKIAVEYDSTTYHSRPSEKGKDSIRATSLELQGIEVINLTAMQLYDQWAFDEYAHHLASRLGKEIRKRIKDFEKEQSGLRKIFPVRDQ